MKDAVENRLKTSVDYGTQEGYMNLPTGNVTLLFAEVERGSAPLHAVPDSHVPVTSLRQALLYALQAQNGYILSMDDENLRAGFSTPEEALHTAV
ncbi:MAG: hypothetical protein JWL77_3420, partial [Chthonomonadaceae bacterium]|nr:hypothetical protein [Chthonomonadaceae bacterium]